jgi:hypothetical protein
MLFFPAFYTILLVVIFVFVFKWAKRHNDLKEEQNQILREILDKWNNQ